jgi:uncharacterized protein YndB with AHSA1/START domain
METTAKTLITVETTVNAPVSKVWDYWTTPDHITKWNNASDDWHTPWAKNDLEIGGKLEARMEAKDGSFGFEFWGTYVDIIPESYLSIVLGDGRTWKVFFEEKDGGTIVTETFEAEAENSAEMQQQGWQAILDNFKKYTEAN